MVEQSKTAEKVVEFLSEHNKIGSINYPFKKVILNMLLTKKQQKMGGNVLSFYIKGNKKRHLIF